LEGDFVTDTDFTAVGKGPALHENCPAFLG
jgi:hypothetical protein